MTKKKKSLYITLSVVVILIICLGIGFLIMNSMGTKTDFNHKRYAFESSTNTQIVEALSKPNKKGEAENFYIMSSPMIMLSAADSNVISFQAPFGKAYKLDGNLIQIDGKMILDCGNNIKFETSTIEFLSRENKMKMMFKNTVDNSTATTTFRFLR